MHTNTERKTKKREEETKKREEERRKSERKKDETETNQNKEKDINRRKTENHITYDPDKRKRSPPSFF